MARLVVPRLPHHVTQRGNRREQVFFDDDDYTAYLSYLKEALQKSGAQLWAWCLMPNHVHLIVNPADEDGLRKSVANAHRRYAGRVNARNGWTGHLWQGRFGSVVMDEAHLYHAIAYVVLNPVRARLVQRAEDWKWSSIHAHLGAADAITTTGPVRERWGDFRAYLGSVFDEEGFNALRASEQTGRPLGDAAFTRGLEQIYNRKLTPQKRGPKGGGGG